MYNYICIFIYFIHVQGIHTTLCMLYIAFKCIVNKFLATPHQTYFYLVFSDCLFYVCFVYAQNTQRTHIHTNTIEYTHQIHTFAVQNTYEGVRAKNVHSRFCKKWQKHHSLNHFISKGINLMIKLSTRKLFRMAKSTIPPQKDFLFLLPLHTVVSHFFFISISNPCMNCICCCCCCYPSACGRLSVRELYL